VWTKHETTGMQSVQGPTFGQRVRERSRDEGTAASKEARNRKMIEEEDKRRGGIRSVEEEMDARYAPGKRQNPNKVQTGQREPEVEPQQTPTNE